VRKSVETELAAARAVARRAGLGAVEPQILKLAKHTSVRLTPLPIVARIQSNESLDQAHASASRELTVAGHLAARGAPSVRPASEVGPGPYVENDCTITLWKLLDGRAAGDDTDALLAARALKAVHAALADFLTDLPSFTATIDSCESILADAELPAAQPNDRLLLQRLYADLRDELSRRELVHWPLHGDTHFANVLVTDSGAIWMDLEAVCTGPLEWDVVTLPSSTWSEFGSLDADLMRLLGDLKSLCVTAWCWADLDRSAEMAEAAAHHLGVLRGRFG